MPPSPASAPSADTSLTSIPILLGSHRPNSNGAGLAQWLQHLFLSLPASCTLTLTVPPASTVPSRPVDHALIPQAITSLAQYPSAAIRAFSALIASAPAVVILTPQYNWGYPGGLKNALDHLYHEWRGKRVSIVSYGGHGGGKAAEQLEQVLAGGLKAEVVAKVGIKLPSEFIREDLRVRRNGEGEWPAFLDGEVEEEVRKALEKLVEGL
ncbi:hypothetical protein JCM8097_000407 [Rhodosporidiobolus ruineniae]